MLKQQAAIVGLHDRLLEALGAVPNETLHPSCVVAAITDVLAYVIVDAAQAKHVETVTDEFVAMLRRRVAHYARQAAQETQGELFAWPAAQDRGHLQ
jgi:hypothetical protein